LSELEEFFEKGLLKKIPAEDAKVRASQALAQHYLGRAKGVLEQDFYDVAFLMAYNSMFQTVRALLFSQGIRERSHYAAIHFLKKQSKTAELSRLLEIVDDYRMSRHAVQYDGSNVSDSSATEAIKDAETFLRLARRVIKQETGT